MTFWTLYGVAALVAWYMIARGCYRRPDVPVLERRSGYTCTYRRFWPSVALGVVWGLVWPLSAVIYAAGWLRERPQGPRTPRRKPIGRRLGDRLFGDPARRERQAAADRLTAQKREALRKLKRPQDS